MADSHPALTNAEELATAISLRTGVSEADVRRVMYALRTELALNVRQGKTVLWREFFRVRSGRASARYVVLWHPYRRILIPARRTFEFNIADAVDLYINGKGPLP